jgi:hypothetical protein
LNGQAVGLDLYPLDQELDNARLFGREQLVPDRVEFGERAADLLLGDTGVLATRCLPGAHNDLRRADEHSDAIDNGSLDLGGGNPADRAGLRSSFDHTGRDVIAIEPAAAARILIGRRQRAPVRPEQ